MRLRGRDAIAYVLSRLGCTHPFIASRVVALADIYSLEEKGERLTDLRYGAGPGVLYIEGLKETIESDSCFVKREGDPRTGRRGCIEYRCEPPSIPGDAKRLLDKAIGKTKEVDEMKLNEIVVNHPLFERLVKKE